MLSPGQRVVVIKDSGKVFVGKLGTIVPERPNMQDTGVVAYFVSIDNHPEPKNGPGWLFMEDEITPYPTASRREA